MNARGKLSAREQLSWQAASELPNGWIILQGYMGVHSRVDGPWDIRMNSGAWSCSLLLLLVIEQLRCIFSGANNLCHGFIIYFWDPWRRQWLCNEKLDAFELSGDCRSFLDCFGLRIWIISEFVDPFTGHCWWGPCLSLPCYWLTQVYLWCNEWRCN